MNFTATRQFARGFHFWLMLLSAPVFSWAQPNVDAARPAVFLTDNIDRPLRYTPIGTDFVITNGAEFFNRPLYGANTAFRVDGGDRPEFSFYLPGRGGNVRFGIQAEGERRWLQEREQIVARYHAGSLIYETAGVVENNNRVKLKILPLVNGLGLIGCVELGDSATGNVEFFMAFGGANGMKGRRNGDIGCEPVPVSQLFQLRPEQCAGDVVTATGNLFLSRGKAGTFGGVLPKSWSVVADAKSWNHFSELVPATWTWPPPEPIQTTTPVAVSRVQLFPHQPVYFLIKGVAADSTLDQLSVWLQDDQLKKTFAEAEEHQRHLAEKVVVITPDAYINAAVAALNVAADAVWDEQQQSFMHGAVAWRMRLLGWRGPYVGDELGWHDRTAQHFAGYAKQQNTNPLPATLPAPEASANLSRNETALHSNGDLSKSHYDMNLVAVDVFFRHLLWTGDLAYARKMWPTIERHLAWERRLFRREFGADKLPLYEAYCCIWASDDLAYNGGGATHSSAYNLFHNRMAARVAKLLGQDATVYEREADLIEQGMAKNLWLTDRGWFAEWKDLLGLQLVHPNAASWTFYHTLDSAAATPLAGWQMTRFVDTQIARIPLRGDGVPTGNYTMPTTSWMPYTWSLNNVVLAETMHTALGYWQANRPEGAFPLFKGALLDSMFLGLCPGNVGMCTFFDMARHESQRDFADGCGAMSRALIEGLFGVQPDLLADKITLRPGWPADWNHVSLQHPDFNFSFLRTNLQETYAFESKSTQALTLQLQIPALRDEITSVTVNGRPAQWHGLEDSVGGPRVEITCAQAHKNEVVIQWSGKIPTAAPAEKAFLLDSELVADCGAKIIELADPQHALSHAEFRSNSLSGIATGTVGHRTVFARVEQGSLRWWQPVMLELQAKIAESVAFDWKKPLTAEFVPVDLSAVFNDRVTQIFRNEYRTPRSPSVSLATPQQGFGSWCHPQDNFIVDDSGLRAVAAKAGGKIILTNGIPLVTPGAAAAKNISFVSQWDNYPATLSVPLTGKAAAAFLLLAGSTTAMQSRFDNGEVIVTYTDGSTERLALQNPTTWWPIDQDYYIDDFAFARPEALPVRIDLETGKVRVLDMKTFKGHGKTIPGGAATVLRLQLNPAKELKTLAVRALANEVVIGLMSVTLQR